MQSHITFSWNGQLSVPESLYFESLKEQLRIHEVFFTFVCRCLDINRWVANERECKIMHMVFEDTKFNWNGQWLYRRLVRCCCCCWSLTPLHSLSKQFITSLSLSLARRQSLLCVVPASLCGGKRAVHGLSEQQQQHKNRGRSVGRSRGRGGGGRLRCVGPSVRLPARVALQLVTQALPTREEVFFPLPHPLSFSPSSPSLSSSSLPLSRANQRPTGWDPSLVMQPGKLTDSSFRQNSSNSIIEPHHSGTKGLGSLPHVITWFQKHKPSRDGKPLPLPVSPYLVRKYTCEKLYSYWF
jgi:hypothetical protein